MSIVDIDELEKKASAALGNPGLDWCPSMAEREFWSSIKPEVTLALVDEVRRLRRLESALEFLDRLPGTALAFKHPRDGADGFGSLFPRAVMSAAKERGWKEDT